MDVSQIKELIEALKGTDVTELEIEEEAGKGKIRLTRAPAGHFVGVADQSFSASQVAVAQYAQMPVRQQEVVVPVSSATAAVNEYAGLKPVESPVVGTFYGRPAPDADSFIEVGQVVRKGQTLCIVEAMKVMNEIEAPCNGKVVKVLLKDGDIVEFGEKLVLLDPSAG